MLSLLSTEMLDRYTQLGFWRDDTIYSLAAAHAATRPDAPAMRDRSRRLSYADLVAAADALAADLAVHGVRAGHRIMVWLPSCVETGVALLACSRNGYVCCPSLHRDHTVDEIVALTERVRAAAVIAQPGYGADADRRDIFASLERLGFIRYQYRVPADAKGSQPFAGLLAERGVSMEPCRDPNRVIYLPFTSGTTGDPKGVMHSDNTLLANARALTGDWGITAASVIYTLSPLSHNLGLGALIAAVAVGGELVVHDLPRGYSLLDRLIESGATFLFGVPTHAIDLLAELKLRRVDRIGSVTGFRISGAAATPDVISELVRYGVVPQSGYGMTETCSHHYTLPSDDPRIIAETSGHACPGFEIKIWRQDNPDVEAEIGEVGQIGSRGASLMLGYYGDQTATEEAFNANGWFLTGDLGSVDAQGFLRITGRMKDVIIRGGHNIYPARIEAVAMRHDAIDKVAAFAVGDDRLGELVCLAMVMHNGRVLDDEAVLDHLDKSGLSRYDMPEYLLTIDAMPLTASGKISKRELAERVRIGQLSPRRVRFRARTNADA
jgi:acyl-CoA synthetase